MTILQFPTERALISCRKTQDALDEYRKVLFDLIDQNTSGTIFLNENLSVTHWNPAAERIFEYTRAQAVARPLADLVFPSFCRQMLMDQVETLIQGKNVIDFSCEGITRTGRTIVCRWHGYSMEDTGGSRKGVVLLVKDITEGEKIRNQLILSEKMMCVGGLAGGIAHEIHGALSGLMMATQLLEFKLNQDAPGNLNAARDCGIAMDALSEYAKKREIPKLLDRIYTAGQHISDVIDNIMDFSKDGSQGEHKPIEIAAVVENTMKLVNYDCSLKKKYNLKKLSIKQEYDQNLPTVTGVPSLIQQVLFNLLKNAFEAMHAKNFCNEIPVLTIRLKNKEAFIGIEVEDNANGMDDATLAQIFNPFFSTKGCNGSGIGLSISRFIVTENFGGQISAVSRLGRGSCFVITLPVR
jgi:PAS domain S-box-containing protein